MQGKWRTVAGLLAVILCVTPMLAVAQESPYGYAPAPARGGPRGLLQVTNDWQDDVRVSLWSHRRERIGAWVIRPGDTALLDVDGAPIKVRPRYKIKVGEDWGWVNVGEVAQFQGDRWSVFVRTIWRATHSERSGIPDWQR